MPFSGVVREVARRIYDTEVVMKVQERKQEHLDAFVTEHVVFVITQIENPNSVQQKSISSKADSQIDLSTVLFIRRRLTALRLIPPSQKKSHLEKEEEPKEVGLKPDNEF